MNSTTEGAAGGTGEASTVLETVEQIGEKITGTATPGESVGVLLDWFAGLFRQIAGSDHPPAAAAAAAETVAAHKDALTAAVLATPATDTEPQQG